MAKTKIEKIASIEEEIKQLENKKKRLIQEQKEQERKDRTNRLCKRMGFIEKLLPDTIPLNEPVCAVLLRCLGGFGGG